MAVSFLLGRSATVNCKDRWGATPMDDCVRYVHAERVEGERVTPRAPITHMFEICTYICICMYNIYTHVYFVICVLVCVSVYIHVYDRGGTLYHTYAAKLLQGWGGRLGVYKNTQDGDALVHKMQQVSCHPSPTLSHTHSLRLSLYRSLHFSQSQSLSQFLSRTCSLSRARSFSLTLVLFIHLSVSLYL